MNSVLVLVLVLILVPVLIPVLVPAVLVPAWVLDTLGQTCSCSFTLFCGYSRVANPTDSSFG
jgi:hypothetical protein